MKSIYFLPSTFYFLLSAFCLLPTSTCDAHVAQLAPATSLHVQCWTKQAHGAVGRWGGGLRRAISGSRKSREAGANSTSSLSSSGKNLASAAIVVG